MPDDEAADLKRRTASDFKDIFEELIPEPPPNVERAHTMTARPDQVLAQLNSASPKMQRRAVCISDEDASSESSRKQSRQRPNLQAHFNSQPPSPDIVSSTTTSTSMAIKSPLRAVSPAPKATQQSAHVILHETLL
jgi:hypothetical protein